MSLSKIELTDYQKAAVAKCRRGSLVTLPVGTGKSVIALSWAMLQESTKVLVITTAKKRDSKEWESDATKIDFDKELIVDSWNNIQNYIDVKTSTIIFDEQKASGYGTWAKSFIKIARANNWILLSATPGDRWIDLMPYLVALGFYKHKTDFCNKHVIYKTGSTYPIIKEYRDTERLEAIVNRHTIGEASISGVTKHVEYIPCMFSNADYLAVKRAWDPFEDAAITNPSKLLVTARRVLNASDDRMKMITMIMKWPVKKMIVAYNFTYELEIIRAACKEVGRTLLEYNGSRHDELVGDEWIYAVQYNAGAEGWNCIDTNIMIFYSMNYSYRIMKQMMGRIDRLNTPYTSLNYYILHAMGIPNVDDEIIKALNKKQSFNKKNWQRENYRMIGRNDNGTGKIVPK